MNDNVEHPKHYTSHPSGVECIEITRHYCFDVGNAIKYLWRAGLKCEEGMTDKDKEVEDLRKAIWYINDRIKQLTDTKKRAYSMNITEHEYRNNKHQRIVFTRTLVDKTEIILHCSATSEGKDYTVEDINRWHLQRGYDGIGYHYVIYRDGTVHRGRPEDCVGAHCVGHNRRGIGICYIGGLASDGKTAKDTRTKEQKAAMYALVTDIRNRHGNLPLHCHNEFATKACPSFKIKDF